MIALQALFALYLDEFPKTLPELHQFLENWSREVIEAFRERKEEKIERAHQFLGSHWKYFRVRHCKQLKSFVYSDTTLQVHDNGNIYLY